MKKVQKRGDGGNLALHQALGNERKIKREKKNIQQLVFAGGHPPNY
jgi:hypothetical protein